MNWLTRLRHTRGFGVHSPFAFRLITECLRERCAYYAYSGFTGVEQCLAFRLAVFLQPVRIKTLGKDAERLAKAARKGCPKPMQAEAPAIDAFEGKCNELLIVGPDYAGGRTNRVSLQSMDSNQPNNPIDDDDTLGGTAVLVIANPEAVRQWTVRLDALGYGMAFIDGDSAIFAIFPQLPRQALYPRLF